MSLEHVAPPPLSVSPSRLILTFFDSGNPRLKTSRGSASFLPSPAKSPIEGKGVAFLSGRGIRKQRLRPSSSPTIRRAVRRRHSPSAAPLRRRLSVAAASALHQLSASSPLPSSFPSRRNQQWRGGIASFSLFQPRPAAASWSFRGSAVAGQPSP